MNDLTYREATRLAMKREECIIKLAMVLPSVQDAEALFAEEYERYRQHPTLSLDDMIDALQERIILEGYPFDQPEPKGILS